MILVVCSIKDRATEIFSQPLFFAAKGQALRAFTDELNRKDEKSQFWNHPDDFDFYCLGAFDDATGQFSQKIEKIADGKTSKIRE